MAFPDNTLQIYDVETRQSPSWARDLCASLPKRFTHAHDSVLGVTFDPAVTEPPKNVTGPASDYMLLWGSTWICKIPYHDFISRVGHNRKRRRDSYKVIAPPPNAYEERDVKMVTHYRPILGVDFLGEGELVVVERPLVDVLSTLPPAYFKHKYGAS